jgi:hypothetical protein
MSFQFVKVSYIPYVFLYHQIIVDISYALFWFILYHLILVYVDLIHILIVFVL